MRVAIDAHVLVAAYVCPGGPSSSLLEDVLLYHDLVTSEAILEDFERELHETFGVLQTAAIDFAAGLRRAGRVVAPADVGSSTAEGSGSEDALAAAIAGEADLLVVVKRGPVPLAGRPSGELVVATRVAPSRYACVEA